MFLDDDSYPLDNRFQYDVARYDKEGKLLGNCILVPRRGRALIPHLCDNLRYADDRFSLGLVLNHLGKPVFGMHGEGMLVRGDILKQYWKDITSIAEDAEFGINAGEGTKFFRSRTEISILSPHSIGDFWKQRRRWYLGLVSILPKFPLLPRVLVGIRMLTWSLGFLSILGWILVPYFLISGRLSSGFATMALIILSCLLFSLSFFMIGARRTKTMPQAIVLFPIYSTIGALLPLYVLLTLNRGWRFEVIDK
jgi:cellulose synthase/poly-beta-1,6-N-acetylglucosamine synthase-like glycosyltransferase